MHSHSRGGVFTGARYVFALSGKTLVASAKDLLIELPLASADDYGVLGLPHAREHHPLQPRYVNDIQTLIYLTLCDKMRRQLLLSLN